MSMPESPFRIMPFRGMSFQESFTWVNLVVTVLVAGAYYRWLAARLADTPATDIAYVGPIVGAMVAMVVLNVVGAIVTAIGSAISAELSGEGSARDIDRKDERDALIARRGDLAGYHVSSALMVGVFALTLLERPHVWIANGLFAAFVVGGLVGAAVKLVAYRRGF